MLLLANRDSLRSSSLPTRQPIPRAFPVIAALALGFKGVNFAIDFCLARRKKEKELKNIELTLSNNFQFPEES